VVGCRIERVEGEELPVYSLESERMSYEAVLYSHTSCNVERIGTEYTVNVNMLMPVVDNNSADDWLHVRKMQAKGAK
jgi:hypothetical protein